MLNLSHCMEALLVETGIHGWLYDVNAFKVLQFQSVTLSGGQRKVPSMTKSDLIVTNIAISVNKSALLVDKSALSVQSSLSVQKKCIFSPEKCSFSMLLSALLKAAPPDLDNTWSQWPTTQRIWQPMSSVQICLPVCLPNCLPAWLPACVCVCLPISVCLPVFEIWANKLKISNHQPHTHTLQAVPHSLRHSDNTSNTHTRA